jgi:4-amino-4-deoxy-L-arabinose transferase-like glycosyltransferase
MTTTVAPAAPDDELEPPAPADEGVPAPRVPRFWLWFWLMGGSALAVRVVNVLVLRPVDVDCTDVDACFRINGDALYSHLQGELFAQGHGFASSFAYWLFGDLQPGAGDPPLYVVYLGLVSALHGSGGGAALMVALAALVAAVALAWWIGRRVGDERPVPLAALVTGGVALLLVAVSVLPGLGADHLGVHRPGGEAAGPAITLPDGDTVAQAAVLDASAVDAHRLASAVAGAAGVLLLGLVARRLGGDRAALVALGLGAIYPMLWINDGMVLSESLYVPMVALVMLAAYRFWDRPDVASAVLFGGAVALAGLTRAEALLLGLVIVFLVWGRRRELGRAAIGRVALAGGVCVALCAPWLIHNLARFEEPTFMTAGTGAVLSAGSCDVAYHGDSVGYYGASCFDQYVEMGWAEWPDAREEESVRDVPSREAAMRYIRENLGELPRVAAFRVARMWYLYRPDQDLQLDWAVEGRGEDASRWGAYLYALVMPAAIAGLVVTKLRRLPISPLVAPAVVVSLTAALTFGVTRYRVPADAAAVVAAAVAIDAAVRWLAAGSRGSIAGRGERGDLRAG